MVQLVLQRRDYLKASTALGGVPELLTKIREVCFVQCSVMYLYVYLSTLTAHGNDDCVVCVQSPDFYMEMKWEFTSWSKSFVVWLHYGINNWMTKYNTLIAFLYGIRICNYHHVCDTYEQVQVYLSIKVFGVFCFPQNVWFKKKKHLILGGNKIKPVWGRLLFLPAKRL